MIKTQVKNNMGNIKIKKKPIWQMKRGSNPSAEQMQIDKKPNTRRSLEDNAKNFRIGGFDRMRVANSALDGAGIAAGLT